MILIKLLPMWLILTLITATSRPERRRRDVFSRSDWWENVYRAARRSKQWPKRSEMFSDDSCDCKVKENEIQDFGLGYWPRVVQSRSCKPEELGRRKCFQSDDDPIVLRCQQRQHKVMILTKRQDDSRIVQGSETMPIELTDQWVFVERLVNTSCELAQP